jgi:hypothetical protein
MSRFPDQPKKIPAETFTVSDSGRVGRDIFKDIVNGIKAQTELKAVSGSIEIEINLSIEDKNIFKDDEIRNSKLVIKVNLED